MRISPYSPQIRQNNLRTKQNNSVQVSNPQERSAKSDVAFSGGYNLGIFIPKNREVLAEKIARRNKALEFLGVKPDAVQEQIIFALITFNEKIQLDTLIEKTGLKPPQSEAGHCSKMSDIKHAYSIKRMMQQYDFSTVDELENLKLKIISNEMKEKSLLSKDAPAFKTDAELEDYISRKNKRF